MLVLGILLLISCSVAAYFGVRDRRMVVPAPLPLPVQPPAPPSDANQIMADALKRAPEMFAEARRMEALRIAMKCCACDEPTAIICVQCSQRVCAGHREAHPCV